MDYIIVIHPAEEGGYWAEVPALPGCFAQGESLGDLLGDARGAIASHLEALREDGQPVPADAVIVASVRIPELAAASRWTGRSAPDAVIAYVREDDAV